MISREREAFSMAALAASRAAANNELDLSTSFLIGAAQSIAQKYSRQVKGMGFTDKGIKSIVEGFALKVTLDQSGNTIGLIEACNSVDSIRDSLRDDLKDRYEAVLKAISPKQNVQ